MSRPCPKEASQRHGIVFDRVPTFQTFIYHPPEAYSQILDCVYEMADAVSSANGVALEAAIAQVLKDENWRVLPTHQKQIIEALERGEA